MSGIHVYSFFKPTEDEWYPPFLLKNTHNCLVEITCSTTMTTQDIVASGDDEFYLVKRYSRDDPQMPIDLMTIIRQPEINRDFLKNMGFRLGAD